ncbi:MAG: hypothetical protein SWN10_24055, partial [Pseudomonadota bacterium]|nr:hypothetical protein [Pseudomonadota bacterium]
TVKLATPQVSLCLMNHTNIRPFTMRSQANDFNDFQRRGIPNGRTDGILESIETKGSSPLATDTLSVKRSTFVDCRIAREFITPDEPPDDEQLREINTKQNPEDIRQPARRSSQIDEASLREGSCGDYTSSHFPATKRCTFQCLNDT